MDEGAAAPRGRRWSRLLRRAAIVLLVLIALGGLLEVLLRAGVIENPQHNRMRVRGATEDVRARLLILGDSFLVPYGLMSERIAEGLADDGVAVLNTAISGTGPFEYLAELERRGPGFEPTHVLLGYYVGNDLTDVQNHPRYRTAGDGRTGVAINTRSSGSLLGRLYLFHYLRPYLQRFRVKRFDFDAMEAAGIDPELVELARNPKEGEWVSPFLLQLGLRDPDHVLDNLTMTTVENLGAWEKSRELLTRIHERCEAMGAELLVLVIPHTLQVNRDQFALLEAMRFRLDERTLTEQRPQDLMRAFCAERGIPVRDLLPDFRARSGESFYLKRDIHMNREGIELAAGLAVEFLEQHVR